MRDAAVLAFANTLTFFTSSRSSKKLTDVCKKENLWWHADGAGGGAVTGGTVQAAAFGAGCGEADMGPRRRQWERKEGQWRRCPATNKMTTFLAATLGPSGGVATGLVVSGGLGVALPCLSAKRFR